MSKILYENFKDYFRVGAAISGIVLMDDAEREELFQKRKAWFEEFKKNFKPQPGMPEFKFTEPEKTEYLLSRINYPRVGIMLDTGHLMNTDWHIRSQWDGIKYILIVS